MRAPLQGLYYLILSVQSRQQYYRTSNESDYNAGNKAVLKGAGGRFRIVFHFDVWENNSVTEFKLDVREAK